MNTDNRVMKTGMSREAKISGYRVLAILLFAFAAVIGGIYFFFIRPIVEPDPLVRRLPEDTVAFVSVDLWNGARSARDIYNSFGGDRLQMLLDKLGTDDESDIDFAEIGKEIFANAYTWGALEIGVALGDFPGVDDIEANPHVAFLINSRSQEQAEKHIPEIFRIALEASSAITQEAAEQDEASAENADTPENAGDEESEAAAPAVPNELEFDKTEYNGVNIYCLPSQETGERAEDNEMSLCWAATRGMALFASCRLYAIELVDSSMDQKNASDRTLVKLVDEYVPPNALVYAVFNGSRLWDMQEKNYLIEDYLYGLYADQENVEDKVYEDLDRINKEFDAVRGLVVSLSMKGVDTDLDLTLALDQKLSEETEMLKEILEYPATAHEIDGKIYMPGSVIYLSVNNLDKITNMLLDTIKDESPEDYEELAVGFMDQYGVELDSLVENLGSEAGFCLTSLKPNPACEGEYTYCDLPFEPGFMAGLQVADSGLYRDALETYLGKLEERGEYPLLEKRGDQYAYLGFEDMQVPDDFVPSLVFEDNYIYFISHPDKQAGCLAKGCGRQLPAKSNAKLLVDFGGLGEIIEARVETEKEYLTEEEIQLYEAGEKLAVAALKVYGPVSFSFGISPEKIYMKYYTRVDEKGIRELPVEEFVDLYFAMQDGGEEEPHAE